MWKWLTCDNDHPPILFFVLAVMFAFGPLYIPLIMLSVMKLCHQ